jgi:uncharacterized protein (DUF305 family)
MQHARQEPATHAASTHDAGAHGGHGDGHYGRFTLMIVLSFIAMYALMFAMVDSLGNATSNLNQAYMAGLMTAPMAMLELALMGGMYPNKRLNAIIWVAMVALLLGCWFLIRQQGLIGDRQFLRSMIPHHAGAILMCAEASLGDPGVVALCRNIESSQKQEIIQMKALLAMHEDG